MDEQAVAATLFGEPERLAKDIEPTVRDALDAVAGHFEYNNEQRAQELAGVAQIHRALGFTSTELDRFYSLHAHHLRNPPDDETVATWRRDTLTRLRGRFGDDGEKHLARAKEFVASVPKLRDMVDASGIGDHPDVVLDIIERAPAALARRGRK